MSRIEEVLLAHGGKEVFRQDTQFDDLLASQGELVKHRKVSRFLKGCQHRCHRNAAGFYLMYHPDFRLATGYTLNDEVWFRHSWLVGREGTVFETTEKRRLYFGVTLDDFQTARFIMTEVFAVSPSLLAHCEDQAAEGEAETAGETAPDAGGEEK